MNFTPDLPKTDPCVSYIVATALSHTFYNDLFRMHAVILRDKIKEGESKEDSYFASKNNISPNGLILCHIRKILKGNNSISKLKRFPVKGQLFKSQIDYQINKGIFFSGNRRILGEFKSLNRLNKPEANTKEKKGIISKSAFKRYNSSMVSSEKENDFENSLLCKENFNSSSFYTNLNGVSPILKGNNDHMKSIFSNFKFLRICATDSSSNVNFIKLYQLLMKAKSCFQ